LTESGQVALQVLAQDVRMAGFGKPYLTFDPGSITRQYAQAGIRGCDGVFTNIGSNAPQMEGLECPQANSAVDSASFAVTYEADTYNSIPVASTEGIADVPSDCEGAGLRSSGGAKIKGNQQNQADEDEKDIFVWRIENRYWIGQEADGTRVLRCAGNGGTDPFKDSVILVRGIDRMVVTYGIGNGSLNANKNDTQLIMQNGVVAYKTAKEIDSDPNWSTEPATVRWQRVISARICLEVAGDIGSADRKSNNNYGEFVNCNGKTTIITDGRQRRAVTMTMNLRNKTPIPPEGIIGFGSV
jgi:hypothetical protein